MQVFKTYFKIVKKNMPVILLYFFVFLFISLLLAGQKTANGTETIFGATKTKIAVFNYDKQSEFSNNFEKFLAKYSDIVEIPDNKERLQDALYYRDVIYIVKIPNGFSEKFINGNGEAKIEKTTVAGSTDSIYMDFLINKYMNAAKSYIDNLPNITADELSGYLDKDMSIEVDVNMHTFGKAFDSSSSMYYFLFFAYAVLSIIILGVSSIMMTFNNPELKKRNLASKMKLSDYNLQMLLGNLVFTIIVWAVVCLISIIIYGKSVLNQNAVLLFGNAFILSMVALSLSFLIGSIVRNKNALQPITNILSLGMCFISGIFVEQELLGATVLNIARFTPTYWYAKAVGEIKSLTVWSSENILPIIYSMLIQLGFAVAILAVALVIVRQKRSSKEL